MDSQLNNASDEYTDYKGRKTDPRKHGGIRAASVACVVEVLENAVFLSNSLNLVAYFMKSLHYPAATSANMLTNFAGTASLLTIVGGFISDSYLTTFTTFLCSCAVELVGLILMNFQARNSHLLPPPNETPSHVQAAILYTGIYAIAIGVGGVKGTLPSHGADQIDNNKQHLVSSFFNWFFFALVTGGIIASTVMVWVEDNCGWEVSFMISAILISCALCIFAAGFPLYRYKLPLGSPIIRIIKVFAASVRNAKTSTVGSVSYSAGEQSHDKFKFLNKALIGGTIDVAQVEETKTFLGLLPIFATTIMMNCCLAQIQTFTVQQGDIMNRKLHNFTLPTQFISVIPLAFMLCSIPLFEQFKRIQRKNQHPMKGKIYQPLARIGVGLALSSTAMAVAALVETKRREAMNNGVQISVFWLGWQYFFLAASDTLTLQGMLEFFYSEAPDSMRSICTSLSYCSNSMGFFFSSVIVTISNSVSGRFGREWIAGHDLNHSRLDLFYTLLCILNTLNLLLYVWCARRY